VEHPDDTDHLRKEPAPDILSEPAVRDNRSVGTVVAADRENLFQRVGQKEAHSEVVRQGERDNLVRLGEAHSLGDSEAGQREVNSLVHLEEADSLGESEAGQREANNLVRLGEMDSFGEAGQETHSLKVVDQGKRGT